MTDEKWRERENIPGSSDSFETLESPLQPISASQACSGALWEVGAARCCVSGGERERESERKWQQMKLAGCGVLFPPARSNEQAFRTDWGNWSPVGPEPPLSHLSGVLTTRGNVRMHEERLHALAYTRKRACCTVKKPHSTTERTQRSLLTPLCVVRCILAFNYDALILVLSFAADGDG